MTALMLSRVQATAVVATLSFPSAPEKLVEELFCKGYLLLKAPSVMDQKSGFVNFGDFRLAREQWRSKVAAIIALLRHRMALRANEVADMPYVEWNSDDWFRTGEFVATVPSMVRRA